MLALFALLCLHTISQAERILVAFSSLTPSSLQPSLAEALGRALPSQYALEIVPREPYEIDVLPDVILDATWSEVHSYALRVQAARHRVPVLQLCHRSRPPSQFEFFLHPEPSAEATALELLLEALGWSSFHHVSSHDFYSLNVATSLTSSLRSVRPHTPAFDALATESAQSVYNSYIAIKVKTSGNWKVLSTSEASGKVFDGLVNSKIYKERCAFLVGSRGAWNRYRTGTILLVEDGLETAESSEEYEALAIAQMLASAATLISEQPMSLFDALETLFPTHYQHPQYRVYNYVTDLVMEQVGTVTDGNLELTGTFIYPGNVTEIPSGKPKLQVSGNTGLFELTGAFNYFNYLMFSGIEPMISLINSDDSILENFEITLFGTNCGAEHFLDPATEECLSQYVSDFGLFYLESVWGTYVEQVIPVFREFDVHVPHVGVFYNEYDLYDKEIFPELMILTNQDFVKGMTLPYIIKGLGIDYVNVVYILNETNDVYESFRQTANTLNVNILNSEEYRYLPGDYELEQFEDYRHVFQHIIDTKARALVILAYTPLNLYIAQGFYDAGLRNTDLMIFSSSDVGGSIELEDYGHDIEKVLDMFDGSIALNTGTYIGEYGAALEAQIASMISHSSVGLTCYMIDALQLGIHSVDLMSNLGRDYEDPELLNYYMRMQRFTGCLGTVSIESDGNGKGIYIFELQNIYKLKPEGYAAEAVGTYTFGVTVPLVFAAPIQFPGGESDTPEPFRLDTTDCGFDEGEAELNQTSQIISACLLGAAVVLSSGVSVCVLRKRLNARPIYLTTRARMTFEDAAMLLVPVAETVVLHLLMASVTPFLDFDPLLDRLPTLQEVMRLELGLFWKTYYICFAGVGVWTVSMLLVALGLTRSLPTTLRDALEVIGINAYPIVGSGLFLGLVTVLFKVFDCSYAVDGRFETVYLANDCNSTCWEGQQLAFAILVIVLLILYMPLCLVSRDYYEGRTETEQTPVYTLAKALLFVVFAALRVLIHDALTVSIIFLAVTGTQCVVVWIIPPGNYKRFNSWQRLLALFTVWTGVLAVVSAAKKDTTPWLLGGLEIAGGCLLCIVGLVLQFTRYPEMLYRKPPKKIEKLFQFQLGKKVKAHELTPHELDYIDRREYMQPESNNPQSDIRHVPRRQPPPHPSTP